jgi:hypothetical protein
MLRRLDGVTRSSSRSTAFRTRLATVALLVGAIATALVACELIVRCLPPYATWWLADVYRSSDVPDVQYTLQPGFDGFAFGAPVHVNTLGFRGPEWSEARTRDVVRIAVIGDSHAFGFGLPLAATMGERAARALTRRLEPPVEVLNFGINGYNSTQELAVLRSIALAFRPDVVVLVPTSNDHEPAVYADADGFLSASPPHPITRRRDFYGRANSTDSCAANGRSVRRSVRRAPPSIRRG